MIDLVPVQPEHSDFIRNLAKDSKNREFFRTFPPINVWPVNVFHWFSNGYIIRDLNSEKYIGLISVNAIDNISKQMEFGIVISSHLCDNRQEFMVSALDLFLRYMFDHLQYNKLTCKVLPHRTKLMEVMKKHHFKQDGILRDGVFFDKQYFDEYLFSVLNREYV